MSAERIATELCDAGRRAFLGGKWKGIAPCPNIGRHVIGSPGGVELHFCDAHFEEINAAGLVEEPYVGEQGFERRMAEQAGAPTHSIMRFRGGPLEAFEVEGPDPAPEKIDDKRATPEGYYWLASWDRPVAVYRWRRFGVRA